MAWNEPGGGNDNDPWGGGRPDKDKGPPDLDEVIRKLQERMKGLFGGSGGKGSGGGIDGAPDEGDGDGQATAGALILLGVALVGLLLWETFYRIEPAERGVVLTFGRYVRTLTPGPHFEWPRPISFVTKVNVDLVQAFQHKAAMLTKDENIVEIELAVQYRIKDVEKFLFKVRNPESALKQVTESALREIIGRNEMDYVLTTGRGAIAEENRSLIQEILDSYDSGIDISSVNMQPAKPPEEVKAAFDDAIKAREDKERLINEAEAYANEVLPKAEGEAVRRARDAEAYRDKSIAQAEGEVSRFQQMLTEYNKAPGVTRRRLYLDTLSAVMANSRKVLLDVKPGSNSIFYLPLDKLMERDGHDPEAHAHEPTAPVPAVSTIPAPEEPTLDARDREASRERVR
jgi:membrane protease subunit HflK